MAKRPPPVLLPLSLEVGLRRDRARREGRRLPAPGTRVRRVTAWTADGLPAAVEESVEGAPGKRVRRVTEWTADGMPKTVEEFDV